MKSQGNADDRYNFDDDAVISANSIYPLTQMRNFLRNQLAWID